LPDGRRNEGKPGITDSCCQIAKALSDGMSVVIVNAFCFWTDRRQHESVTTASHSPCELR